MSHLVTYVTRTVDLPTVQRSEDTLASVCAQLREDPSGAENRMARVGIDSASPAAWLRCPASKAPA